MASHYALLSIEQVLSTLANDNLHVGSQKRKTRHAGGFVLVNESLLLAATGEGDSGEPRYKEGERPCLRQRAVTWPVRREQHGRADSIEVQQMKVRGFFVAQGVGVNKDEPRCRAGLQKIGKKEIKCIADRIQDVVGPESALRPLDHRCAS